MNSWHRWNYWSFVFYYEDESLSKACSKLLILKGDRLYHFKFHVELSDAINTNYSGVVLQKS